MTARAAAARGAGAPGVAIVGMACELPDAATPEALWQNVLAGRRAFRRIPPERLDLGAYGHPDPAAPDRSYGTHAAVIDGYTFDRRAFRVPPESFHAADPVHWLALDVAARALADAGFAGGAGLPAEATGVIVGNTLTGEVSRAAGLRLRWPYVNRLVDQALAREGWAGDRREAFLDALEGDFKRPFPPVTEDTLPGGLANTIAGRIAGHFDLKGGGYIVDGACASSLLAIIQACEALTAGRLDCAIAGGVDLSLDPFELVGFAKAGALARDAMRVYDASPTGFWPGEGCGMVVLMRLADAEAAGRPIHAVLRGWGIASDGAGGITRPEEAGQRLALERAYRTAGLSPDSIDYIEGHGTGTAVGDAVELAALSAIRRRHGATVPERGTVARRNGTTAPAAAIGSVKALIGHTKAAAGVAGLLKAVMALRSGILPPTAGCETPHPLLREPGAVLRILDLPEAWPDRRLRRAGVSAFGFGGINTHVVVEQALGELSAKPGERGRPARKAARLPQVLAGGTPALPRGGTRSESADAPVIAGISTPIPRWAGLTQDAELLLFAAHSRDELAARLNRTGAYAAALSPAELGDLAAALAAEAEAAGPPARWRAALVAGSPEEAAEGIAEVLERLGTWDQRSNVRVSTLVEVASGKFLSSPQSASPGRMVFLFSGQGSPLPSSRAWLRRFPRLVTHFAGACGAAVDPGAPIVATERAQPALVSASLAALDVLTDLAITADVALGHSLGELSALHWAGVIDAAALARLAEARGRAMAGIEPSGAMAAISASPEIVAPILDGVGAADLVIAGLNGPRQTVIAGPAAAVARAVERARGDGLSATPLAVSGAFHSPLMAPARPVLARALAEIVIDRPCRSVVSTVTGMPLRPEDSLAEVLLRQLTSPVRFAEALAQATEGAALVVEVGPGQVLADLARGLVDVPVVSVDAGGASLRGLLATAGAAFATGSAVPRALFADRFFRPFALDWRGRFLANPCEASPHPPAPSPKTAGGGGVSGSRLCTSQPAEQPLLPIEGWNARIASVQDHTLIDRTKSPPPPAVLGEGAGGRGLASPSTPSPSSTLRTIVARRLDLPPAEIHGHDRFRSDLHLSSIAVAEVLAEAARALGVAPPTSPTDYATASLDEAAAALATRPDARSENLRPPAGVASWVRPFRIEWVVTDPPIAGNTAASKWCVLAPPDLVFGRRVAEALAAGTGGTTEIARTVGTAGTAGDAVVVILPPGDDSGAPALLLEAAQAAQAASGRRLIVAHTGSTGAPAFARCLGFEGLDVTCVDLPYDDPRSVEWLIEEARAAVPAVEVRRDAAGRRLVPRLVALWPEDDASPAGGLTGDDVLLVTGGGKGIGAEAGIALALRSGARLGLIGRSEPGGDAALDAQLDRLAAHGVRFAYQAADVADGTAVERAVRRIEADLGPVTAVLHAAGRNVPTLAAELDLAEIERTVAPKVAGLASILAALAEHPPRWLVSFGSVIARTGLGGEAHYAMANARLREATEAFARENPTSLALCVEWSVWAGIGMGERLGSLEALECQGITPLPPDEAVQLLVDLMAAGTSGSVVVAGRLGTGHDKRGGLLPPVTELPLHRFLEQPRVWVPGVELVADVRLSADTDPYLADHALDGTPLLPAVMGLEAMAQAVAGLTGWPEPPAFVDVAFRQAIPVATGGDVTLRVAALTRSPDHVDVVLRTDSTGFAVDHMRATALRADRASATDRVSATDHVSVAWPLEPATVPDVVDLYGSLLFQRGRLHRLAGFQQLSATACEAELTPRPGSERWFGPFLPQHLILGDPGGRDAALQALQACVPHRRVLPVAVESVRILGATDGRVRVRAVERLDGPGDPLADYLFDLETRDEDDRLLEVWTGLRLRAVGDLSPPAAWPCGLLGSYLERRLGELLGVAPRVRVRVRMDVDLSVDSDIRRPDGKPERSGLRQAVSRSRADGLVLEAWIDGCGAGTAGVGCDVETVCGRPWADLLGTEGMALARAIAAASGEPADAASARVWAAREAALKAGWARPPDLTLEQSEADGWVLLRGGRGIVATAVVAVGGNSGQATPLVFAFAGRSR